MKLERDGGRVLARMQRALQRVYYRYSLEVGISVLEWWEAVLVNTYFLLLVLSLAKQVAKVGAYLIQFLL